MDAQYTKKRTIYYGVYLAVVLALIIYILFGTDFDRTRCGLTERLADFSAGWLADNGEVVDLDEVTAQYFGGSAAVEKVLPETIGQNKRFCLTTSNLRLRIIIDGVEAYSYDQPENLTGKGYGMAYHLVNLPPEQAGKTVRLEFASTFDNHKTGRIYGPMIGNADSYRFYVVGRHLPTTAVSIGMTFLGVVLLIFYLLMPDRKQLRLDLASLALVTIIVGVWTTNDTGIFRLLTGSVIASRVIDHAMLHLIIFPLALLVSSVTAERKTVYLRLIFALTVADIAVFLILRYVFHVDMAWLPPILAIYYALSFAVIYAMLASNKRYCLKSDERRAKGGLHRLTRDRVCFPYDPQLIMPAGDCCLFRLPVGRPSFFCPEKQRRTIRKKDSRN